MNPSGDEEPMNLLPFMNAFVTSNPFNSSNDSNTTPSPLSPLILAPNASQGNTKNSKCLDGFIQRPRRSTRCTRSFKEYQDGSVHASEGDDLDKNVKRRKSSDPSEGERDSTRKPESERKIRSKPRKRRNRGTDVNRKNLKKKKDANGAKSDESFKMKSVSNREYAPETSKITMDDTVISNMMGFSHESGMILKSLFHPCTCGKFTKYDTSVHRISFCLPNMSEKEMLRRMQDLFPALSIEGNCMYGVSHTVCNKCRESQKPRKIQSTVDVLTRKPGTSGNNANPNSEKRNRPLNKDKSIQSTVGISTKDDCTRKPETSGKNSTPNKEKQNRTLIKDKEIQSTVDISTKDDCTRKPDATGNDANPNNEKQNQPLNKDKLAKKQKLANENNFKEQTNMKQSDVPRNDEPQNVSEITFNSETDKTNGLKGFWSGTTVVKQEPLDDKVLGTNLHIHQTFSLQGSLISDETWRNPEVTILQQELNMEKKNVLKLRCENELLKENLSKAMEKITIKDSLIKDLSNELSKIKSHIHLIHSSTSDLLKQFNFEKSSLS